MIEDNSEDLVVQHNNLVNSRFEMTIYEMRMFLFMLGEIERDDNEFKAVTIPVSYFRQLGSDTKSNFYKIIKETAKSLHTKEITIESFVTTSRGRRRKKFHTYSLMAESSYVEGAAYVQAEFNDKLAPYLLELKNNFTTAQLNQLLLFKSFYTHRIYWLLKQYANFNERRNESGQMERRIDINELRSLLGAEDKYERYDHFRKHVIMKAQKEMNDSDLPFVFSEERIGRMVSAVVFAFSPSENVRKPNKEAHGQPPAPAVEAKPLVSPSVRASGPVGAAPSALSPQTGKRAAKRTGKQTSKISVLDRLLRFGLSEWQARRFSDKHDHQELQKLCYNYEVEFANSKTLAIKKPPIVYMGLCKHYNLKP